jgi:hypothetical protein
VITQGVVRPEDLITVRRQDVAELQAAIAERDEAVKLLAEAVVQWDSGQEENYYTDALRKTKKALVNPIARAAVDAAKEKA